jgi:hypothetical protein
MEKTFKNETAAHTARRSLIGKGVAVSLIAYDPSRDLFVFDVLG